MKRNSGKAYRLCYIYYEVMEKLWHWHAFYKRGGRLLVNRELLDMG